MRGSADGRAVGQACPPAFPSANSRSAFKKGVFEGQTDEFRPSTSPLERQNSVENVQLGVFLHFAIFQGCSFGPRWGHFGVRLGGHVGVVWGSHWSHSGVAWGRSSLWDRVCVKFGVTLVLRVGAALRACWGRFWGSSGVPWVLPKPQSLGEPPPRALGEPPPTRLWGAFPELRGASPRHSWASIDPQKGNQHLNSDPRKGTQHLNSDPRRAIRA